MAKTIFFTYLLGDRSVTGGTQVTYQAGVSYGYSAPLHCNYVSRIETDTLDNKTINVIVPDASLFPFFKEDSDIAPGQSGEGWTASKFYGIVQVVDGTGTTVSPNQNNWKIVNLTPQLDDYEFFSGSTIPKSAFNSETIIKIKQSEITAAPQYNLSYLNYPSALSIDNDRLAFGEEVFFFGNVNSEIKAIAYTTDVSMVLPLNQYNGTTNPTWDGLSPIQISEAGLFDADDNLIAVGKFNYPIAKDSTVFRTVQFSFDF